MKLTGNILKDHEYLCLEAIADSAIESASREISLKLSKSEGERIFSLRNELAKTLVSQAKDHYKAQVNLKTGKLKKMNSLRSASEGAALRDFHHTFMRHWLASILVKNYGISIQALMVTANGQSFHF